MWNPIDGATSYDAQILDAADQVVLHTTIRRSTRWDLSTSDLIELRKKRGLRCRVVARNRDGEQVGSTRRAIAIDLR